MDLDMEMEMEMEMDMEWELVMDEDQFVQVKKLDDHDLPSSTFNLVHLNYFICPPDQINIPIPKTKTVVVDDHQDEIIHTHSVKKLKETEFVDKPTKVNNVSERCEEDSESESGKGNSSDNNMKNQVLRWMGGICTFGVAAVAILVCNQQHHHHHHINYNSTNHRMRMAKKMKKGSRSGKGKVMKNIDEGGGGGFRIRQARISFGGYCNASL